MLQCTHFVQYTANRPVKTLKRNHRTAQLHDVTSHTEFTVNQSLQTDYSYSISYMNKIAPTKNTSKHVSNKFESEYLTHVKLISHAVQGTLLNLID